MKKWHYTQISKLRYKNIKSQRAFTLIEIMIVIAIIGIIILGTNFLSFNNISNKDKLDIKTIKVYSQIEKIRNNALLGKGIGTNLFVPEKYKIDFSTSGSGIIKSYYFSGAISDYVKYSFNNENIFDDFNEISKIKCLNLDKTSSDILSNTETGTLLIEGPNLSISGALSGVGNCGDDRKILELEIKRKLDTEKIQINTLNGLIEIKK